MNLLTEVKAKYPKAYYSFEGWYRRQDGRRLSFKQLLRKHPNTISGWLTAFFDDRRIRILLLFQSYNGWQFSINQQHSNFYPDRNEAFTAAAIKAFEILEERL